MTQSHYTTTICRSLKSTTSLQLYRLLTRAKGRFPWHTTIRSDSGELLTNSQPPFTDQPAKSLQFCLETKKTSHSEYRKALSDHLFEDSWTSARLKPISRIHSPVVFADA